MNEWTTNNLAQVHTWLCMVALHELPANKTFDVSGDVAMGALAFWSALDSSEMRASKANALAAQMDNIFRLFQGAQYEAGFDGALAVLAMSRVLQDATRTLKELAAHADECYQFKNEVHA